MAANVNLTNLRLHDGEVPDDAYFVVISVHEDVAYKIRYDVLTETLVRTVASTPITDADILFAGYAGSIPERDYILVAGGAAITPTRDYTINPQGA